jgi:transposase-like protein
MGIFVPCPYCGNPHVIRVSCTWWGGVLGPRLFNHVRCSQCRKTFNGKTGKSNAGPITMYSIAMFFIILMILSLFDVI